MEKGILTDSTKKKKNNPGNNQAGKTWKSF